MSFPNSCPTGGGTPPRWARVEEVCDGGGSGGGGDNRFAIGFLWVSVGFPWAHVGTKAKKAHGSKTAFGDGLE